MVRINNNLETSGADPRGEQQEACGRGADTTSGDNPRATDRRSSALFGGLLPPRASGFPALLEEVDELLGSLGLLGPNGSAPRSFRGWRLHECPRMSSMGESECRFRQANLEIIERDIKVPRLGLDERTHRLRVREWGNPRGYPIIVPTPGPKFPLPIANLGLLDPSSDRIIQIFSRNSPGCAVRSAHAPGRFEEEPDFAADTLEHIASDILHVEKVLGVDRPPIYLGFSFAANEIAFTLHEKSLRNRDSSPLGYPFLIGGSIAGPDLGEMGVEREYSGAGGEQLRQRRYQAFGTTNWLELAGILKACLRTREHRLFRHQLVKDYYNLGDDLGDDKAGKRGDDARAKLDAMALRLEALMHYRLMYPKLKGDVEARLAVVNDRIPASAIAVSLSDQVVDPSHSLRFNKCLGDTVVAKGLYEGNHFFSSYAAQVQLAGVFDRLRSEISGASREYSRAG